MKIVHLYKDFDPPVHGGIERHVALMCAYQREWAEVEALTCSRSWRTRRLQRDGVWVTEVGEWGRFQSAPVSPAYPWRMRRLRADVLVAHAPNPTTELGYLLARPRGALVVRYHSDVVRQAAAMRIYGPIQMHFLRKAAMILPTSDRYAATSPVLQAVRDACRAVPLGIRTEEFAAPSPDAVDRVRRSHGGSFVFFAGRHRYYKGLDVLVRAARAVNAAVVIAGDGPERPRIEALARELEAPVTFTGTLSQEDLVAHLHACELFVFPSIARSEAFGMALLEAHACGKPAVATALGTGVEFANLDGETGRNVPPGDPDALAGAVNALLADGALRARMGAFAKERVERDFHARTVARREFELYCEAAGRA